jgi:hypothetical protein
MTKINKKAAFKVVLLFISILTGFSIWFFLFCSFPIIIGYGTIFILLSGCIIGLVWVAYQVFNDEL